MKKKRKRKKRKGPGQLTFLSFIISLWAQKMRQPFSTDCQHVKMPNEKVSGTVCGSRIPLRKPGLFSIVVQLCQMECTINLSVRRLPYTDLITSHQPLV